MKLRGKWAVVPLCFSLCSAAHAVDFGYRTTYAGEYSNNVRLTSTAPADEFANTYGVGFNADQEGAGLDAAVEAFGRWEQYTKDTSENTFRGTLDLTSTWHIRPGTFDWYIRDFFRQVTIDDTLLDSPDNRQDSNTLSTGPDFIFRLTSRDSLRLEARYNDYYFEEDDFDSQGYSTSLRWLRQFSPRTVSGFNVEFGSTDYDDDAVNPDFDRLDAFWSGEFTRGSNSLTVNLGATSIKPELGEDVSGFLGSIVAERAISSQTTVSLDFSSDYSDTGRASSGAAPNADFLRGDIFYRTRGALAARRTSDGGHELGIRVFTTDVDFENFGLDRKALGAGFDFRRVLAARFSVTGNLTYTDTEFDNGARIDNDWVAGLTFDFALNPSLNVFFGGTWRDRDSDDTAGTFDEGAARVGFTYRGGR